MKDDKKLLTLSVRVTNESGEFLDSGDYSVVVSQSVASDDYDKLFDALRTEYPELYEDYPDCNFEITNVEAD
jgi:hypothetical protein